MFQRREEIRTQAPFLFADSLQVAALQQQCKETLGEIFRLLRSNALSPYETINWSPVRAAKFFECLLGRGRWTLCRQHHAPVGCRKGDGPVLCSGRSLIRRGLTLVNRHMSIQTKTHARSKPRLSEATQVELSLECGDMSPLSKRGHVRALQSSKP